MAKKTKANKKTGSKGASVKKDSRKKRTKKKTKPRKVAKKKQTSTHKVKAVDESAPITLMEARKAISPARAKATKKSARRGKSSKSKKATTVEDIARKRKGRDRELRSEREQRVKDFKAIMSLMKRRGVKGLGSEGPEVKGGGTFAMTSNRRGIRSTANTPLQILAEGDSWFDYPVPLFGGGIIPRLEDLLGVPILNLAKAGDEVRSMLGVEARKILTKHLKSGSPAGGDWDVLLFSGGGNDIVGESMALWVREFDSSVPPAKLINQPRFENVLKIVKAGYEDLIKLRNSHSPNSQLIFHSYDFAIPDGRGICFLGPWMKPTFDIRNFKTRAPASKVVKAMLQQFAQMLESIERRHSKVTFINTQGTLRASTNSWHNELHPSEKGFQQFAKIFHKEIRSVFPDRVL